MSTEREDGSKLADEGGTVIHVVFGRDGTYELHTPASADGVDSVAAPPPGEPGAMQNDPLADLYSTAEVGKLFGIAEGRLRSWARSGFLAPSARRGRRIYYTFQDLVGLRAAKGLLDAGISLAEVKRSVDAMRRLLPRVTRPLVELRVMADGQAMVVKDQAGTFEPLTGQRVLDFSVENLREDVVEKLRRDPTPRERRSAYEAYLEGCRLDENAETYAAAEAAYRRAVALDPSLANALTNLGNLAYRQGDEEQATRRYREALQIDPDQPEALYNLGYLALEAGRLVVAEEHLRAALAVDAEFADAHFNLGRVLREGGDTAGARAHWRAYLELEPEGEWAGLAERNLRDTGR